MASGWLARVARRFGEMLGSDGGGRDAFWSDGAVRQDVPYGSSSSPEEGPAFVDASPHPQGELGRERSDVAAGKARDVAAASPEGPFDLPPGVRLDENGRFVAGGYSFSTLDQARGYLDRTASRVASSAPSLRNWREVERDRPTPPAPSPVQERRPEHATRADVGVSPPSERGRSWIRSRTRLKAGGHEFVVDLVPYGAPRDQDPRRDHSRIDPFLPVNPRGDPAGDTLSYWPSYSRLDPRARWTYLDWIARGRSDPAIPIGYVFLFFYGLEQRLLVDDERNEAGEIFAEVRRLLAIHGGNYSFQSYAARFLALAAIYEDRDEGPPTAACASSWDLELPLDVRLRLGERLRDGKPFDADDALRWVLALPDVHLRTPGQRCFEEFRALWWHRFAERHPDGLKVRTPKSVVRHEYRAASGTFSVKLAIDGLPDISGTAAPLGPLRAMLDVCMEDLSPYSRLLGRDPEAKGRLRGDLLLPAAIRADRVSLAACREALRQLAGTPSCPTAAEVAQALDLDIEDGDAKLGAQLVRQLCAALDALDFGFEPDRRYGAAVALRGSSRMAVFQGASGCAVEHDRAAYAAARGTVEVAVLAAASDGEVAPSEVEALERRLRGMQDLNDVEVARLMAHARALAADPPKIRAALKKLGEVAPGHRSELVGAAIEAVLADGRIAPDEVRFLEALHTALGLPVAGLYSALHRAAEDEGPVSVVDPVPERMVPLPPVRDGAAVPIDTARLERVRHETSRVSALLATIFTEEEAETPVPAAAPPVSVVTAFEGLDGPHSALLERLVAGPLARNSFEALASELRLMPEGALETINEWGFDRYGGPVIEEDGDVFVLPDMVEELQPMGVAA